MADAEKAKRPLVRAFAETQALRSRIPPVRAVAVSGNLYKSHACLPANLTADARTSPPLRRWVRTARLRAPGQVSDWVDRKGPIANSDRCEIADLDTLKASKLFKRGVEQGLLVPDASRGKRHTVYSKPSEEAVDSGLLPLSGGGDNEPGDT